VGLQDDLRVKLQRIWNNKIRNGVRTHI